jgi:hypothetical protein
MISQVLFVSLVSLMTSSLRGGEAVPRAAESSGVEATAADASPLIPAAHSGVISAVDPKSQKGHLWYYRRLESRDSPTGRPDAEIRILEYDPDSKRPVREGYAQFKCQGSQIVFVNHHDRIVVTYEMQSSELAASLLSWPLASDLARCVTSAPPSKRPPTAPHESRIGSFRRPDGRVALVQQLGSAPGRDVGVSGLRIASFIARPQPGDRPLIRDVLPSRDEGAFPAEVARQLDVPPPDTSRYVRFSAVVGTP